MRFLLDTCVISELVKPRPEPAVLRWIAAQDEERLCLSVLTLGEIEKGIAKLDDTARAEKLRLWVEEDLRPRFEGRWLNVTGEVAREWGRLQGLAERRGRKIPVVDGLIAATALAFDCNVVTRNVADLGESGVKIYNPWP